MAHLFQVGAGSGGMPVLDLLCQDSRITHVTLVEPDVYKPHNVERHLFPQSAVGELKAVLAEQWLKERRPDLEVQTLVCDLCDPAQQATLEEAAARADVGVCAVDNETAKYHWDALMRRHGRPWTLGEVLSGGIGGFVHWFAPGGPCYGCVASHLQRAVVVDKAAAPDYSTPGGPVMETTIPASKASIHAIASLHALVTLALLDRPAEFDPGFTTLLLSLQRVRDIFEDAFRSFRFRVPRAADCLICQARPTPASVEDLDVALDQALARLAQE
jgi:molybdopterin/thiamine biosynthesis adenylyltransferase